MSRWLRTVSVHRRRADLLEAGIGRRTPCMSRVGRLTTSQSRRRSIQAATRVGPHSESWLANRATCIALGHGVSPWEVASRDSPPRAAQRTGVQRPAAAPTGPDPPTQYAAGRRPRSIESPRQEAARHPHCDGQRPDGLAAGDDLEPKFDHGCLLDGGAATPRRADPRRERS